MKIRFKGVWNIIRFNWHFYLVAIIGTLSLALIASILSPPLSLVFWLTISIATLATFVSLLVSWYVYDLSSLYSFSWLPLKIDNSINNVINVHAGFDESSTQLRLKFPQASFKILDFYDAAKHTEVSIQRARKAYPPQPETVHVETNRLPLLDCSIDYAFSILAAHEIRNDQERVQFFSELNRCINSNGRIVVVEHLRDWRNFLAYNIGFLHFLSKKTWKATFRSAGLAIDQTVWVNPFITAFVLEKNGTSS